ncbi:unnamed protein product [Calypogeia fissa]
MPALGEVLALPAPPPGGVLGPFPTSQLPPEEEEVEVDNAEKGKPASVATHTRTIGMIHPPPDVRSIVDKTAQFVARNGPEFEKRILANEKGNVKFNFLKSEDPYHAYYQHRVSEFRTQLQAPPPTPGVAPGGGGAPKPPEGGANAAPKEAELTKADNNIETKPVTKVLDPPEPEQYTVRLPDGLTSLDLDIIKLTAQFVARNGKSFLNGLTNREHSSPQFYFLKPTHSMFSFFTALADAYSKVLMPPKGLVDRLKRDASSKTVVLERCLQRLEWERSQERARQKAEDEIEQERMQMALIDWHDFVVVETIEFAEEEDDELPQPMTLEEVIRRSKAVATEEDEEDIAAQAGREVEMEMDDEEMELVEESMKAASLQDSAMGDDATEQSMDDEDPPMRIVKNWRRPEDRIPAEKDPAKVVVSPITGELIQINEMAEHMRISLIDPKYKEQKERMMAKLRETTLATDDEISRNIVGLARTRPDIFGTTEEEVSNAVKAEIEKKKEEPKQVIWDGHTGSISRTANQAMAQTMTLDEQIAAIHREKANLTADGRPLPGPAAPPGPKLAPPPQRPLPPPPGLAPNIPRTQHLPPSTSTTTTAPPAPPMVQRPAILPTPPPPMRPPPPAAPPAPQNPLLVRPPAAPLPPPMASPPAGVPQYAPPPRPFAPVMPPAMPPMAPPPPPPPSTLPPPPPPEEVPPPPPEEPEPKRQKMDEVQLIPEDQFLAQHPGPVRITVSVPSVEGEGNLKGQLLELTIQSLSETILNVKEKIANELALPANKQKLNSHLLFLKDNLSLAHYNIGPGETLTLGLRERGGRKK